MSKDATNFDEELEKLKKEELRLEAINRILNGESIKIVDEDEDESEDESEDE